MRVSKKKALPYPLLGFKDEAQTLDWALSVLANTISKNQVDAIPPEAFSVFERLITRKLGQTVGEAIKEDLETLDQRIKHLEAGQITKEWNPSGQRQKIRA